MNSIKQPRYIGGPVDWPILRAPYAANKAQAAFFYFKANCAQLQATCDTYLNAVCAPDIRYQALVPYAMMSFVDIPSGNSMNPVDERYGLIPEQDLSFWIPTLVLHRIAGVEVPVGVAFFAPYLFVDNLVAAVIGREVFGFRKQLGSFIPPTDFSQPEFSATTLAIRSFGPAASAQVLPLMNLSHVTGAADPVPEWRSGEAAARGLLQPILTAAPRTWNQKLLDLEFFLLRPRLPVVFLKQFPDIANSGNACYQAICEAPIVPGRVYKGGILCGEYVLTLPPLDTHPIARELGLQLDASHQQRAAFGFWATADFVQESGREVVSKAQNR